MAYKNTLITGITDFLVLAILKSKGDCYAYEISKYITSESNELLSISPNTIYTVMYKLENEQMISEYSVLVGKKRTRIYYHIESDGEAYLKIKIRREKTWNSQRYSYKRSVMLL